MLVGELPHSAEGRLTGLGEAPSRMSSESLDDAYRHVSEPFAGVRLAYS